MSAKQAKKRKNDNTKSASLGRPELSASNDLKFSASAVLPLDSKILGRGNILANSRERNLVTSVELDEGTMEGTYSETMQSPSFNDSASENKGFAFPSTA